MCNRCIITVYLEFVIYTLQLRFKMNHAYIKEVKYVITWVDSFFRRNNFIENLKKYSS